MTSFVKMLQRTLLLCVILSLGLLYCLACPKNAGIKEDIIIGLQRDFEALQLSCHENIQSHGIALRGKDFKKLMPQDLCAFLRASFNFYAGIPRINFSKKNVVARSRLMNTMNSTTATLNACEQQCAQKTITPLAKKKITNIEKIDPNEMDENSLCQLKSLLNNLSMMLQGNVNSQKQKMLKLRHKSKRQEMSRKESTKQKQKLFHK